jgi:4,5-dihydroxyphthalate decarboxylase
MSDHKLHAALQTFGYTEQIKNGSIHPTGFVFDFEEVPQIIQAFRRMVRGLEFDMSEMAITTYMCAKQYNKPFTALPVFVMRAFHHGAIVTNKNLGITHPKQLEGKKVGVNRGFTVTAGVWARSILQHEYGVDLSKITWVLSGDEHVEEFKKPSYVVTAEKGANFEDMLLSGELAAASGVTSDNPDIVTLIPNAAAVGYDALRARGHYPINHTVVVKNSLLEAHPTLARDLFAMFAEAKKPYLDKLKAGALEKPSKVDQMLSKIYEITGKDPLPYGVEPNRAMLENIIHYAREQNAVTVDLKIEDLFAKGTLDLIG